MLLLLQKKHRVLQQQQQQQRHLPLRSVVANRNVWFCNNSNSNGTTSPCEVLLQKKHRVLQQQQHLPLLSISLFVCFRRLLRSFCEKICIFVS